MGKKYYSYDDFVKKDPARAERLFSTKLMPTDDAVRRQEEEKAKEVARTKAIERLTQDSYVENKSNVAAPGTADTWKIPFLVKNSNFRNENLSSPTPALREVANRNNVSSYVKPVSERIADASALYLGEEPNKKQHDIFESSDYVQKYNQQKKNDIETHFADKDVAEKPVSLMSDEEKQAVKNEFEGYGNKNYFERMSDVNNLYDYDRKQALYPNYREIKNEDAYNALIAHGMTDEEIQMLNGNPLSTMDLRRMKYNGETDETIENTANEQSMRMADARDKFETLIASIDDSWGVTKDDIINMVEDRYANPEVQKMAAEDPVWSSVYTLAANPFESAFEAGANAFNYATGRPLQNYQTTTELARNAITENIDSQIGKTLYGGGMSIGDTMVAAGLGYLTGGGSIVAAGVQALEKASQVMGEGVDRGLNPDQIFAEGIASGISTYVTEKIPMGMFAEVAEKGLTNYTAKEIGKYLGAMFVSEGLQEAYEDVADWTIDGVLAWDKNEFYTDAQNYIKQGMSPEEAMQKVIAERATEMMTDFFFGGLGGAHMGSMSTTIGYASGKYNNTPSAYIDKILGSPKALTEMASAVNSIDTTNLTGEDLERVKHAKEVANKANPTKEDVVDMANVINEQANAENRLADVINDINYQASVDQNLNEYAENKEITPKEYETEIEKAARNKAESIAVQMEKAEREALRSREKALRDYEIKGIKSKLGEALNNIAQDFENEAAQKNFLENYKGQNASWYAEASLQAFHAGESGQSFNTFLENSREANLLLSENQVTEAYLKTLFYNGQNARTEESTEIKLAKNPNRGLATGGVDELTDLKQKIAEKLGVEVATNFEDAVQRGDFAVALARITVNATADNQYSALMHEMFEFARAYNPKGMAVAEKTIVDMLVNKRGEKAFVSAVNSYKEAYRKAGREAEEGSSLKAEANKTFSEAQEEFVNDAISYIFSTEEGMNTFVDYLMNDKSTTQTEKVSALQAIKDWIDNLIKSIKSFISKAENKNKQLGYEYAELANFNTDELEKLSRLLTGVLDEARENLTAMTEKTDAKAEKVTKNEENSENVKHALIVKEDSLIKKEAEKNIKTIANEDAITNVLSKEEYDDVKKFISDVLAEFKKFGYSVFNRFIGDIELTERGIQSDIAHNGGPIKRATYFAIPDVLSKGKIIDFTPNYDKHGKDRIVIAAPVTVDGGDTYLVGVVVERIKTNDYQKYYMHSVAAVNKNGLPFSEVTNNGHNLTGKPLNVTQILKRAVALSMESKTETADNARSSNTPTDNILNSSEKINPQDIVEGATEQQIEDSDVNTHFSLRVDAPPKKTIKAYKVFVAFENDPGHLYPPMVASPGGSPTALGVWLDADTGEVARDKEGNIIVNKNGRMQVKQGGKGTNKSGGGTLAWRPGWHLGEYPDAKQFAVKDPKTGELKSAFPANFIFAECEIAADNDYQLDAMAYGVSEKGKFNRSQAGLPYIPKDGYYKYRTNPDPNTAPWYITGSMKVSKILDDAEVREVCAKYGVTPLPRVGGDIDLSKYGFKAGIVNESNTDNLPPHVDYSEEIKKLPGYVKRDIDFDDPSVIKEFEINNLNVGDYRHSLAVHAGDLGKSEGFWQMTSSRRGTGHFGTGTYFVGDEEQINKYGYENRPHEKVDFDNYNLFKPKNYKEGMALHEALKFINNSVYDYDVLKDLDNIEKDLAWLDVYGMNLYHETDMDKAVDGLNKLYDKYGKYLSNYEKNRLGDREDYKDEIDFLMNFSDYGEEIREGLEDLQERFDKSVSDLANVLGISEDKARQQMLDVLEECSKIEDAYHEARYADSPSTRFMKAFGYEGIDVRDIKQMDNVEYGSVIYDLKGDDLKRKQEIGTARFSLPVTMDSEGRKLSKEQQEYFKDSKIRDEEGNLLKVYHGSMADFTVFDIGEARDSEDIEAFFFSPVSEEAEGYGNTRAFYLNITNPADFDTAYDIFFKHRKENPAGAGARAREELISLGYDGVAAIDSSDPEYPEYLAFYPEQIKLVSNTKPTEDADIRFSLDVPIEETKDLIAVHNIHEDELMKTLELGGFPMPSIAITKANMGHDKYGNISVLFRKDTIDPQKYAGANKVYSGDAYTPEFPQVDYKINSKKAKNLYKKIEDIIKAIPYIDKNMVSLAESNLESKLNSHSGDPVEAYRNNNILKNAYLEDKGIKINMPMKEFPISDYHDNSTMIKIADLFNDEDMELYKDSPYSLYDELKKDGRLDQIIKIFNEEERAKLSDDKKYERWRTKEINENRYGSIMYAISKYKNEGLGEKPDMLAYTNLVDEKVQNNQKDYIKWISDLFDGVVEKPGIYNGKDYIKASGNRRSWDELHYEYTLKNIVDAMKQEPDTGSGVGGYSFFGSATREYSSIEDIKADKDRLRMIDDEEYMKLQHEIADELNVIAARISNKTGIGEISAMSDIAEAVAKNKTAAGVKKFLSKDYRVTDNDIAQIMALEKRVEQLPTGYFEAKPQRAVGFDEIAAVVIPDNDTEVKEKLEEKNIPVVTYKAGDTKSRIDAVNSVEDIRFSLSVSVDSEGNKLSEGQQDFFADSKVRDDQGHLLVMYHGTPNGTFTVFRGGTYFTNMAWYADRYQNQGASSLGYKKTADNPKTYAAYLNITKPFDTRDPKVRKIWDEQYYQKWDTGEITERGLPDWTSAEGLIEFIEENGYDFDGIIIDEGGVEDGKGGVTSRGFAWIPLKGEDQVKDINNLNPTNNPDYRFSIAVDSKGNSLSKGQQRFFKNSKVRDENGNLKVMYHGTERGGFTVFDPEFSDDGISLFFTDDKDIAKAYSGTDKEIKLYRTAKDLEELIHDSYTHIVKDGNTYRIINGFDDDAVTEFEGNFDELKEYVEEQYGVEDATNYKVYLNAENPLIIDAKGNNWDEIPEVVKGLTTTREYAVYAKENGYDSVIINNVVDSGVNADSSSRYKNTQVVIVFDSNQVKSVDNLNPTDDPDIRHSVDVPSDAFFDAFQEVEEQVKIDESDLEKFIKNGDLESDVTKKAVKDVASAIKKQYNSNIKLDRLTADIMSVFKYLKSTGNMSMKDIMFVMKEIARPVLEDVKTSDPEQEKMYKDFINKLKGYKISLDAGQTAEVAHSFGSYYEFQRAMNGKMNLSKNGTPLDNIWTELCDISDGHLSYGTNPNDQPLALAEYIYGLQPSYQTMEGETLDDAATDLALEIFRQFYVYQSMTDAASKVKGELNRRANEYKNTYKKAYNDALKQVEMERNLNIERLAKELDNLTAEEQEALRTGDALNKAMIENLKADYQRRLDRLRAQSNEKIAREKAKFQNAWITKNLKRERSELKNRVLREVKALQNLIAHPSEGATKHVPINLIKPTIEMLEAINLDNGGRNKAIAERLKKMAEVYESFKGEEYSFDYDERIANDIKELQEMFENKSYADLEIMELERVIEIVTALKTQIKNANNLILQGKLKDAQEAASSAMSSVRQSRRYDNAAMNALNKYANVHLNAYREFRKLSGYMGGALMDIYEDLDAGSKKEMQIQKDLGAIFQSVLEGKDNQKEVKKFISTKKDDLVDIGLTDKNGKPILISRAMRMSLIMHSMNASNMRHVLGSGITIPNMYYFEKGKMDEAYAKGTNYRFVDYAQLLEAIQKNDTAKIEELTKAAEQRIEDMKKDLSEWEKKFLAAAEEMFHEKTGKYINETSLALKGYAIARVKNYFPIKTDSHFTTQEWAGLVQNGSLEGSGVLKERVVSTKPILLEDITNVIERQIRFTSKYAGLAIAVRNFETIMKQTSRSQTDGQLHNLYETIDSVWGASDTKWLKNLMQDIQGGRSEAKSWLMNLRGQFAGATLTLNPSVAIKQAASYPTAAAVVGYKALGKAMADMRKGFITQEGIKELEEINPLLWYRNQGNATQELADAKAVGFGKSLPQWMQKAINWTQWFDTGTVRTLEYASKYYVDEHFPKLEKGSEEYWQKVSEVFTNVVEQTQPNYSTLHKADIIRNPNSFVKMLVMFKTQPMQNFGIVYDAMGELNAAKISGNKKWISEASSKAALAISSQAVSATVFSAMTILSQLLLHRWWKYRDDEGKWSWEKFWVALGEGALSCFTGAFIGGSELYEALKHIFTGSTYYGIEVSVAEMVNDFVENIGKITQNAKSLWDSKTEADRESAAQKLLKSSINLGATVGEFEGTPVNNIKNMLSAMYFYATDIVNSIDEGELSISDDSNIATWEIETQYERIYQSLNDPERYDKLVNELKDKAKAENPDLTEEEIADKVEKNVTDNITKLVKKDYLEGEISYEDTEKYLEEEKGKTEDEAFFQIREWETGESTWGVLRNSISEAAKNPTPESRKAVIDEINVLLEHGKDKSDIAKEVTKKFKPEYIELYNQGKAADLNAILRTAYVTMGYTDEDAKKKISDWLK